jgi:hypothetical protein
MMTQVIIYPPAFIQFYGGKQIALRNSKHSFFQVNLRGGRF